MLVVDKRSSLFDFIRHFVPASTVLSFIYLVNMEIYTTVKFFFEYMKNKAKRLIRAFRFIFEVFMSLLPLIRTSILYKYLEKVFDSHCCRNYSTSC